MEFEKDTGVETVKKLANLHDSCPHIQQGICYFCGKKLCINGYCKKRGRCEIGSTTDHIPPEGFFEQNKILPSVKAKPQISKISTRACFECNNSSSKSDDIFITYITFLASLHSSPARQVLIQYRIPKLKEKNNRLRKEILESAVGKVDIKTAGGIPLGEKTKMQPNAEHTKAIFFVLKKIVKGFYYNHEKKFLDKDIKLVFSNVLIQDTKENLGIIPEMDGFLKELRSLISSAANGSIPEHEKIKVYDVVVDEGIFSYAFCSTIETQTPEKFMYFYMKFYDCAEFVFRFIVPPIKS